MCSSSISAIPFPPQRLRGGYSGSEVFAQFRERVPVTRRNGINRLAGRFRDLAEGESLERVQMDDLALVDRQLANAALERQSFLGIDDAAIDRREQRAALECGGTDAVVTVRRIARV